MSEPQNLYSLKKEELFSLFSTKETGLSEEEAAARLKKYGENKLTEKKGVSPLQIYFNQFKSILILILIAAAILTFLVYFFGERATADLIEGGLILAIVLMITILGFVQEYRAEKAIEALKKLLAFKAKVVRDGTEKEIDTSDLVPGDVVVLEEGEKVPADIRLLEVFSLAVNEASLTGESSTVNKKTEPLSGEKQVADQNNMVFSSTVITQGRGVGLVVKTGDKTEIGKIAQFVSQTKEEPTPIQKKLDRLGRILGYGTLAISAIVFLFIVFFANEFAQLSALQRILQSFIAAVALAVAAIPEGLPAVVTISLALGTGRMLKRNALVRRLTSMETLGSVDVICADKTGTLTRGEMTVREIYFEGKTYEVTGSGYRQEGEFLLDGRKINPETLQPILDTGLLCNNATLGQETEILGDPTEAALLISATKAGLKPAGQRIHEIPFSSERKMMSVVVEKDGKKFVFSKGAPEVILAKSISIHKNGGTEPITKKVNESILAETEQMSKRSLRSLGFAYKEIEHLEPNKLEDGLIFLGIQAMMDPPRKEVEELINQCNHSGIRVVMITGDHIETAKAVAAEVGISGDSLIGEDINKLSTAEFEKKVKTVNIYARVNPEHKFKIVEALKKQGHLVAMTGDGVNDAPALKKADIGVAMGIQGTDVAKEASDLVLLDDHFKTIVAAIEEGRGIFDNIRKFVNYLLSSNIGEVLIVFLGLLIFQDIVLTAVMLLWINVVTDGLPAVALGLDPAEKGILNYSPKRFQGHIINTQDWLEMIAFGLILAAVVLGIYWLNLGEGTAEARSAAFMAVVFFELVRLGIIRSNYKIPWLANPWLLLAVGTSIVFQLIIVYVPVFADWFEISPLDVFDWLYITTTAISAFIVLKLFDKLLDRYLPQKT